VTASYPRTWATNYREPNAAGQGADGDEPGGKYKALTVTSQAGNTR
jgi:hypothetical protein